MATRAELEIKHKGNCKFLTGIELPDSIEWMESNLPDKAYPYICQADEEIQEAILREDERTYDNKWEKYYKAWVRVWQLMAKEHFHSRDIHDVDMRYFRHLPDGYSFVMDSSKLKCKILVLPRKPRVPPDDMRYITAGELIKVHECPAVMTFILEFGAWFDRRDNDDRKISDEVIRASKKRVEEIAASGKGMKLKKVKGGWSHYG